MRELVRWSLTQPLQALFFWFLNDNTTSQTHNLRLGRYGYTYSGAFH